MSQHTNGLRAHSLFAWSRGLLRESTHCVAGFPNGLLWHSSIPAVTSRTESGSCGPPPTSYEPGLLTNSVVSLLFPAPPGSKSMQPVRRYLFPRPKPSGSNWSLSLDSRPGSRPVIHSPFRLLPSLPTSPLLPHHTLLRRRPRLLLLGKKKRRTPCGLYVKTLALTGHGPPDRLCFPSHPSKPYLEATLATPTDRKGRISPASHSHLHTCLIDRPTGRYLLSPPQYPQITGGKSTEIDFGAVIVASLHRPLLARVRRDPTRSFVAEYP